jgi:hypothetical protein
MPAAVRDLPPETCAWIETVIAELEEAEIEVRLVDAEQADCHGSPVGGYFDEDQAEFVVATGGNTELWLSVFVHEYMHFRQSQAATAAWTAKLAGGACPQQAFDAWLSHVVEMTPEQLLSAVGLILAMERECETMALAMLSGTPELPLDPSWYTRAANVYLGFYGVVMQTRRWYVRSPYSRPEPLALVPGDRLLTVEEAMHPSQEFESAIRETCFVLRNPLGCS